MPALHHIGLAALDVRYHQALSEAARRARAPEPVLPKERVTGVLALLPGVRYPEIAEPNSTATLSSCQLP